MTRFFTVATLTFALALTGARHAGAADLEFSACRLYQLTLLLGVRCGSDHTVTAKRTKVIEDVYKTVDPNSPDCRRGIEDMDNDAARMLRAADWEWRPAVCRFYSNMLNQTIKE